MLAFLAWQDALDNEAKKFAYESVLLKDTVGRSVTVSDDVTNNIATLLEPMDGVDEEPFRVFVGSVLSRHAFIESVSYYPLVVQPQVLSLNESLDALRTASPDLPMDTGVPPLPNELDRFDFSAPVEISRGPDANLAPMHDLFSEPRFRDVLRTAIETNVAVPTPPTGMDVKGRDYFLLKTVFHQGGEDRMADYQHRQVKGLIAVLIDPERLFQSSLQGNLSVALYSESEGVSGRQQLFDKQPNSVLSQRGWAVASLAEEILTQFPHYSMKLVIGKQVHAGDIDKGLIMTAMVLGAGVSLLLFALARAKEHQARELRERNVEIGRQVLRQTKELAAARDQALDASRVKSEFLASMSHEIRTPLNAIIGMAELLAETRLTHDQRKYVDIFKKAGEALQTLVNDVLDLSKIEAHQLVLEHIAFDVRELVAEAVDLYVLKANEKGLQLVCRIDPDVPLLVNGDPARLRQVILNLVGNATKFTDRGEVIVRVRRCGATDRILFSVCDTGIGIPSDKLETVFASFTQVDSSTTRRYGGTGLGLSISKRLIELMHGEIWAESALGEGTTIAFSIKLDIARSFMGHEQLAQVAVRGRAVDLGLSQIAVVPSGDRETPAGGRQADKRASILLVEDNADNRVLIKAFLKDGPFQVEEAENGETAVNKFQLGAYGLVLMDVQMPVMDGHAATRAIRAWETEHARRPTPIIALTAHALKEDVEKSVEAGCTAHLTKPIRKTALLEAIQRYVM